MNNLILDLDKKDVSEIRSRLNHVIDSKDIPLAFPRRFMGVTEAELSDFLSGKSDSTGVMVRACAFLQWDNQGDDQSEIFVKIRTAERIIAGYKAVNAGREFGIAYGDSGIGKSTALKFIRAQHPEAIIIEADPGYTARDVFEELCNVLGIHLFKNINLNQMKKAVMKKLEGGKYNIIADEGEELPTKAIELLRRVRDRTGTGLFLVGMPKLNTMLRDTPSFKRVNNRIRIRIDLDRGTKETWADAVRELVSAQVPGLLPFVDILHRLSNRDFRRLKNIRDNVITMARVSDKDFSEEMVHAAVEALDEGIV